MNSPGSLYKYFLDNGHKRLHKWIHYFGIYEKHFQRFCGKQPVVIEIGVFGGGSLSMWKEYFGPGSQIVGIDINPECKQHEAEGIEVFIGSQDDPNVIEKILSKYGSPDIVIDDGSHVNMHMIASLRLLYRRMKINGVYLVEDTHTSYLPGYGGGLRKEGSFIEFCKSLIDELNACYTNGAMPVSDFTKTTNSICFYDSIVVFERQPQGARQAPITGPME